MQTLKIYWGKAILLQPNVHHECRGILADLMQSVQHNAVTQLSVGSKATPKFYGLIKHYITLSLNQTAKGEFKGSQNYWADKDRQIFLFFKQDVILYFLAGTAKQTYKQRKRETHFKTCF